MSILLASDHIVVQHTSYEYGKTHFKDAIDETLFGCFKFSTQSTECVCETLPSLTSMSFIIKYIKYKRVCVFVVWWSNGKENERKLEGWMGGGEAHCLNFPLKLTLMSILYMTMAF